MIVAKAYSGETPESHLLVEITPTVLRELASRLEERAKVTAKDRVLTLSLTNEITLAYQVEEPNYAVQVKSAAAEIRGITERGQDFENLAPGIHYGDELEKVAGASL